MKNGHIEGRIKAVMTSYIPPDSPSSDTLLFFKNVADSDQSRADILLDQNCPYIYNILFWPDLFGLIKMKYDTSFYN